MQVDSKKHSQTPICTAYYSICGSGLEITENLVFIWVSRLKKKYRSINKQSHRNMR